MRRPRTRLVIALVLVAAGIGPALAPAQTRPDPIQELTARIGAAATKIGQVRQLKGKKIAVGEFRMVSGGATELAALVANLLQDALSSQTELEVVSRNDLCQVIRENKLWVSDQFDPQASKKMGALSQADFLVPGRVTALDRIALVTVSVVDTETGRSVYSPGAVQIPLSDALIKKSTAPIAGDGCDDVKPTDTTIAAKSGGATSSATDPTRLQVKVRANKDVFKIGEPIQISVRVNRDAYVTLVDLGTSGQVTVLYPNRFHQNNFVRGGQDVTIPPADASFALAVQGPRGFEQIRAIATEEPVNFAPSDFSSPSVAFRSLDRNQARNITIEKNRSIPSKWAEDVIALEIRP